MSQRAKDFVTELRVYWDDTDPDIAILMAGIINLAHYTPSGDGYIACIISTGWVSSELKSEAEAKRWILEQIKGEH